jgi:hypothetical protein
VRFFYESCCEAGALLGLLARYSLALSFALS